MPGTGTQVRVCFLSLNFTFSKRIDTHTENVHMVVIFALIKIKSDRISKKIENKPKKNPPKTKTHTHINL